MESRSLPVVISAQTYELMDDDGDGDDDMVYWSTDTARGQYVDNKDCLQLSPIHPQSTCYPQGFAPGPAYSKVCR